MFLSNSALLRIEVKSRLDAAGMRAFAAASEQIAKLLLTVHRPSLAMKGTINSLFAFDSTIAVDSRGDPDTELRRLLAELRRVGVDQLGGIVSMIRVANRGFWKINDDHGKRFWARVDQQDTRDAIVWFEIARFEA